MYLRWILDQKNNENIMNQIQELVSNEKELRTRVSLFYSSNIIREKKNSQDIYLFKGNKTT